MRLTARLIRRINRCLAGGGSFYNDNKPLPPAVPDRTYTHIVAVNPRRY
jgi:hypothetical protein